MPVTADTEYPPDRSADPRVKSYIENQEQLRAKLTAQLKQDEQLKQFASDEQIWTNYEYIEVFDQLAQYVCNRYPLNSKWRKQGPSDTLNDVEFPTKHGSKPVKVKIDTVAENRAATTSFLSTLIHWYFRSMLRLVPNRAYKDPEDFLGEFYRAERITITHSLASASNWSTGVLVLIPSLPEPLVTPILQLPYETRSIRLLRSDDSPRSPESAR